MKVPARQAELELARFDFAAQMGFTQQQIRSREFRAEKEGEHISRLLIE